MIVGAAFCPHPPLLVPTVARGAAGELEALRAACRDAITAVCAGAEVLMIGAGTQDRWHPPGTRGSFSGVGVDLDVTLGGATPGIATLPAAPHPTLPPALPLSLAVGAWLLSDADCGARSVTAWETADGTAPHGPPGAPLALVVMGDGSARRSTSAPGYLDDRAAGFDAAVAAALAGGVPSALAALDGDLAVALLAAGAPAWHAAAQLLAGGAYRATLDYEAAPYGVGYFVSTWHAA